MKREIIKSRAVPLSVSDQCSLLNIPRSSYYYKPRPIKEGDLKIMHRIDEIYTQWPFLGTRRIRKMLNREGIKINRKKVQRFMRIMGIQAIYPKKWLSQPILEHNAPQGRAENNTSKTDHTVNTGGHASLL